MNDAQLIRLRTIAQAIEGLAEAALEIVNDAIEAGQEPEPDIKPEKPQPRYFGDDDTPTA